MVVFLGALMAIACLTVTEPGSEAPGTGPFREIRLSGDSMGRNPLALTVGEGDQVWASWIEVTSTKLRRSEYHFAIAPYDPRQGKFDTPQKAFPTNASMVEPFSTFTRDLALLFRKREKGGASFFAVFDKATPTSDFPPYFWGTLEPEGQEPDLRATSLAQVFGSREYGQHYPFLDPPRKMSLHKGPKDGSLFVFGFGSRMWSFVSSDNGKSWAGPNFVDKVSGNSAEVAVSPRGEFLLFFAHSHPWVKLVRSKDGRAWGEAETLDFPTPVTFCSPFIEKDGTCWLVLRARSSEKGGQALFLTRSADHGKTWARPLQITKGEKEERLPCVAVSKGKVFVLFQRAEERRDPRRLGTVVALVADVSALEFRNR